MLQLNSKHVHIVDGDDDNGDDDDQSRPLVVQHDILAHPGTLFQTLHKPK